MKEIIWQPKAKRQLKKIKERQVKKEILAGVDNLVAFPDVAEVKALTQHKCTHRLRIGNFRVLFNAFNAVNIISVEEVKKRNELPYC